MTPNHNLEAELAKFPSEYLSSCPFVLWVKDNELRYRYVNQAWVALFEREAATSIGQDDYAFFPKVTADELRVNDARVLESGEALRFIEDVAGANGEVRRWLVQKFPLQGTDGHTWIGGFAADVTEWLAAEASLRHSEENYRRLVEASPFCIHQIDSEGRLMTVNSAGLKMLEVTSAESVIGRDYLGFVSTSDRLRVAASIESAFAGDSIEFEFQSTRGNHFRSIVVPIRGQDESVSTLLGITEDVTARKEADDRLRSSNERYRLIALATGDPIWEIDLTTGNVSWNETYDEMFGIRPSETQGSWDWWTSRIHAEDRERVVASLKAAIDNPTAENWAEDYRFRDARGVELFIQDRAFISRRDDGSPLRIIGAMRDQTSLVCAIRERQELLNEAREGQRLESLGVLAGGIAHDFNNLLTVMLGNISLMQLSGVVDDETLGALESAVERASEICQQMLAYAGKGRFELKPICLSTLVKDIARLLQVSVSKRVDLKLELNAGLSCVMGDEAQLSQLVMNLAINGAESIGDGKNGQVTIRVSECVVDDLDQLEHDFKPKPSMGPYVCLEVKDSGVGIDAATMERMFDPFFTTKFTGRGMGLSAVQGIIKGHGGALSVDTQIGVGTSFRVLLPALPPDVGQGRLANSDDSTTTDLPGGTILIVDDEQQVRRTLGRILEQHGYRIRAAVDGANAVDQFCQAPLGYQLILLDLTMPQMDGVETLSRMREINSDIPIIMMSGYGETELTDRLVGHRVDGYLKKPFSSARLLQLVNETLAVELG